MSRPLRLQLSGGLYHVMSRGNDRRVVFRDDFDRWRFLDVLDSVTVRLDWAVFAYCLMDNHYHLFIETPDASLASGMRDINGTYAQSFNRRYGSIGHVFQARYKSVLVEGETQFLTLLRYIALNPVEAGVCPKPEDWPWSSHRAMLGLGPAIRQLVIERTLNTIDSDRARAIEAYQAFVTGNSVPVRPLGYLENPGVMGREAFARDSMARVPAPSPQVPRRARRSRSLYQFVCEAANRNEAIRAAYASGTYSLTEIARHFGLHASTVGKICRVSAPIDNSS